jgi:Putative Flp pilus-assembly TadE/G-like
VTRRAERGPVDTRRTAGGGTDRGSVLVLSIGLVALTMVLVGLVIDSSRLFLTRQDLASLADGAALAAAQNVDIGSVYRDGATGSLPLLRSQAVADVARYVQGQQQAAAERPEVVTDVVVGRVVVVRLAVRVRLPLLDVVLGEPDGVQVVVTARAHTAVTG